MVLDCVDLNCYGELTDTNAHLQPSCRGDPICHSDLLRFWMMVDPQECNNTRASYNSWLAWGLKSD